jgi:hypothetical protein
LEKLTEKQAFAAMVLFLEEFYQRTQVDEIGGPLSDLYMQMYWMHIVATVKGVTDLKPFEGYTPDGTVYLVSATHQVY